MRASHRGPIRDDVIGNGPSADPASSPPQAVFDSGLSFAPVHAPVADVSGGMDPSLSDLSHGCHKDRSRGVLGPTRGNEGDTMNENTDVVVIGGGYAGVQAANRLMQRDDVTVTLINPRPTFVERIRLHQLVGGSYDAVVDYREVLAEA